MCSNPKMICSSLCSWPIFNSLESKFVSQIHMVFVYGTLGNEALIVTKDKMVYGLGKNVNDCLGIGNKNATLKPQKVEALCGKDIKTFACGIGPHVLALTKEGEHCLRKVYSWGFNNRGQLAQCVNKKNSLQVISIPTLVQLRTPEGSVSMKRIMNIACGSNHSVAITEDGEVYICGDNRFNQLGNIQNRYFNSSDNEYLFKPQLGNDNLDRKKIVHVSCGGTFTMAITKSREVYGWGNNSFGKLGIRENYETYIYTPQRVNLEQGLVVVKVVCGIEHTLALTDEKKIYAWGRNNDGQLGIGHTEFTSQPIMIRPETEIKWVDIAALNCSNISVAVSEEGRVYVWGNCHGEKIVTPTVTPFSNMHDAIARYGPSVMHEPLILYVNGGSDILECLKTAFNDSSTSDLKIEVEGQVIYVHKAILKIRSLHFKTMFQHNWKENNQSTIKPVQFSYVVYKAFLKYLYTDVIDLPIEKTSELLDLAEEYCESNLKQYCIHMIKQGITVSNVAHFYAIAVKCNLQELEKFCVKFAINHKSVMTDDDFVELIQKMMKTFIMKVGKVSDFKK
ncbi:PREDICTED: RCC1 and BTB domain-containing protein 1-like isoform X1 [Atta colombica]|uniref:RCC1 and BTB domain-containing protein 1-like isoform X1 n=2 Tax=Atta colombica TaxID=520822 RepID=UPI00084C0424|nr:PREDICTED: RCC1 and BTB domain-containing protein 1-like isoform X1 [Atta colombica]XP_018048392.1 PREDICTED: RCC1 and BTB domain-containing protein 1-like isoform X1 [Atta colombica]XP_018048394.1 PREDICTED: RCC1 and BTB domain-containing protein 1-like isoform X1 [Atta colombica]XP_018048395.1 PREDICTED: RCC1 and BTB domain-containing protein 1-like isoform X1 [Atta colombica]